MKQHVVGINAERANVLVVTPFLGAYSEVWLWRQLVGFRRLQPAVLTWQHVNQEEFPLPNIRIDALGFDFNMQKNLAVRIVNRLGGIYGMNFFGPSRQEKRMIYSCIDAVEPEVVLCHFGYAALRILPVVKTLGLPLVVHFHGRDISASLHNRWYRWSLKEAIRYFSGAVVVGKHQARKLSVDYGMPDNRIFLIPCGVPTDEFTPSAVSRNDGAVQFISVARICEEKGLDYSLRAYAQVAEVFPFSRYIIIGDGPLRNEIEQLSEQLKLSDKVFFTGKKNPSEIVEYLRASDIFVQHSIQSSNGSIEGFGVTIAEASSIGLPVVVTNCGGIVDQVIDGVTGYIVPQRDTLQMAERMKTLATDIQLRKKMGIAGRERMINYFDTSKQIQKLENCIDQVRSQE